MDLFNAMLTEGISLYPVAVEHAAHVCEDVWTGIPPEVVVAEISAANPTWDYSQAEMFVGYAIVIYCPPADLRTTIA